VSSPVGKIEFHSSQTFSATVWKTLVDERAKLIFIESRDSETKRVSFSAWDLERNIVLWENIELEEKWWISLGYVSHGTLLFTLYTDTNNPDQKSVIAFDIQSQEIKWWKNNFVVAYISGDFVAGQDTKFGSRQICLEIESGKEVTDAKIESQSQQNFNLIRPLQYIQGTDHFESVKAFLERKCSFSPVHLVEYREYHSLILISTFTGQTELANFLIVFNSEGDSVLKEQLGENLKGIAYDTFFILSGFLIFVKNKRELISYRFV
jgi:hypothetical protein